jgi:flagellin-like hook-associated protein FlgL
MTEKIEREVRDAWLALDPSDPVRTGYAAWQPWMVEQVNSYGFFTFYVLAGQVPASSPPSKIYDYMTKVNPEPGESYNTVWNALAISGMPWKAAPPDEPKAPEDAPLWIQTGANAEQGVLLSIADMSAEALGLKDDIGTKLIDVRQEDANAISRLLTVCDTAQEYVSQERAKLGAMQNRLEHSMRSVDNSAENLSAAESRIRDADMAKEMMEYNKSNVIAQAGISLMAQANQLPQNVLLLLR